jgi:hypothetical protein
MTSTKGDAMNEPAPWFPRSGRAPRGRRDPGPDHLTDVEPAIRTVLLPTKHSPNISHPERTWAVLKSFLEDAMSGHQVSP